MIGAPIRELFEDYLLDEIIIGQLDGKPLYRKVINTGALPNATQSNVSVSSLANVSIFRLYGIANATANYVSIPLPFVVTGDASDNVLIQAFTGNNNAGVRITTGSDRTAFNQSYVVVEYTKS